MKTFKILMLAVLSLSFLTATAQKHRRKKADEEKYYQAPQMPVNPDTKLITYEGEIKVEGLKADQIYKKTDNWMKGYFKNSSKVIKAHDFPKKRIYASPRFRILTPPDKKGTQLMGGIVLYEFKIEAHDGYLKYKLTKFHWKQPSYYPIEKWMDTSAPTYQKRFAYFLKQVDEEANKVINDMKKALQAQEKTNDDW